MDCRRINFKMLTRQVSFISLPQFLSHCNKNFEGQNKGFKTTDKLSSIQHKQTDLLLHRHSRDMGADQQQSSRPPIPLDFPLFILPISSFWLCPVQNRAYTHLQSRKGLGIRSRPIDSCRSCNSRLCCACLPIILSVIIRCIYV